MSKRDFQKIIEAVEIDDRYDINTSELSQLMQTAKKSESDLGMTIRNAFLYGYAMGLRKAKSGSN